MFILFIYLLYVVVVFVCLFVCFVFVFNFRRASLYFSRCAVLGQQVMFLVCSVDRIAKAVYMVIA